MPPSPPMDPQEPLPPSAAGDSETLRLLGEIRSGNRGATDDLFHRVYDSLRDIARRHLSRQRRDHTLEPTALVHEAYIRLVDQTRADWNDRGHFLAVAARAMRHILVDSARRRGAARRGGDWRRVSLAGLAPEAPAAIDLLALEDALEGLSAVDGTQARIVELRFFGGLTMVEVAAALSASLSTVEREWRMARAWLLHRLQNEKSDDA